MYDKIATFYMRQNLANENEVNALIGFGIESKSEFQYYIERLSFWMWFFT